MENFIKKNIYSIFLIFVLVFSRLIPHPANFTPVIAVAILSGFLFRNIYLSLFILTLSMFLSDFFIIFYKHMIFVYLSLFFICYISHKKFKKINFKNIFIFSLVGSILFFIVSNFGVWLLGNLYEKNISGLINCYILAIPFYKNTLISTLIFCYIAVFALKFKKNSEPIIDTKI